MARENRKSAARGPRRAALAGEARSAEPRGTSESGIEAKEGAMQDGKTHEVVVNQVNQATGKALDAMTTWAEANQRVLDQLVELGTGAAKESIRLYAELQQSALDAFRDGQATALRWQSSWQEAPRDPVVWYQKAVAEGVEGTQKWFRMIEGNAHAVTKSAERLQASAEQVGRGIQKTFSEAIDRMKDVYAKN